MVAKLSAVVEGFEVVEPAQGGRTLVNRGLDELRARFTLLASGRHALFRIQVRSADRSYVVMKRFSDFVVLQDTLFGRFGVHALPAELPSKTLVRLFEPALLEDRRRCLDAYLQALCRVPGIADSHALNAFLAPSLGVVGKAMPVMVGDPGDNGGSSSTVAELRLYGDAGRRNQHQELEMVSFDNNRVAGCD
mmetsp:Transcript_38159/g.110070  ORF Transcript_38159/g.110070 Transcript_38159/m.110070 type:complete len:192 (+) Transcript_38159:153-728(+)